MQEITKQDFKDLEKNLVHSTAASARLISGSLDELNKNIKESSKETEKLSIRTWWLNFVLGILWLTQAINAWIEIYKFCSK